MNDIATLLQVKTLKNFVGALSAAKEFKRLSGEWPEALPLVIEEFENLLVELGCAGKAQPGESQFTVLARDFSAPATVDFWTNGNLWMRKRVEEGVSPAQAAAELRTRVTEFFAPSTLAEIEADSPLMDKFAGAMEIADDMEHWTGEKKLAD